MITLPFQKFQLGDCIINCNDMSVTYLEQSQSLPAKVFEFLKLLISNAQRTVNKEQAIETVWEGNVEVGKRGVGNAIWQLRKTWSELGLEPDDYFKTIPKVGYQLLIPVTEIIEIPTMLSVKYIRSNRVIGFSMVGMTILLGLLFFWVPQHKTIVPTAKQPKRITHFEGVEEQAAISPDGKRMAFLWQRDRKQAQIYIKDLIDDKAPLRQVSMSKYSERNPTWSPDGQSLAYFQIKENTHCSVRIRDLITNHDRKVDTGCAAQGYRRNLAWSPDGKQLAYVKSVEDKKAIFSFVFATEKVEQITKPEMEIQDVLIQWLADSSSFIYVREHEMNAVLVKQNTVTHSSEVLPYSRDMIIGLAFSPLSNRLFATALKNGAFVIEEINLDSGEVNEFHQDSTISSLSISLSTPKLYYSNHIGQEFITVRDIETGAVNSQVVSSSRDLFGQYLPATEELLYVSNRNGNWELWSKNNGENQQLTDSIGLVSLPTVSPVDSQFAVLIKPTGKLDYQLYVGDRQANTLDPVDGIKGDIKYPSFSADGRSIVYSINVDGKWGIHQYSFTDNKVQHLHPVNARYALKTADGLYFSKENQTGIYFYDFVSKIETLLIPELHKNDWGNFFIVNDGVFFVSRTKTNDIIKKRSKDGSIEKVFDLPAQSIRTGRAIAAGAKGKVVVSMLGINDADIYEIDLK